MRDFILGVDIGGTSTEVVVFQLGRGPVSRVIRPTRRGRDLLVAGTAAAIDAGLAEAGIRREGVSAVGVGVPGSVDPDRGEISLAVNLDIGPDPLALGEGIEAVVGRPTLLENDVRCAAVGAHHHLQRMGQGVDDLVYVGIGTGISAGLVLDGRLHRGRDGMAGEIGHVVVAPGAGQCACGLDGCLEVVASGAAITRRWATDGEPAAESLFAAAANGVPEAVVMVEEVVEHLLTALQWLMMANAVDVIVLGGGVGSDDSALARALRQRFADLAEHSVLARRMLAPDRLLSPPAGLALGALGAAVLAGGQDGRAVGVPDVATVVGRSDGSPSVQGS